jgi:predicted nucleic acid-binding protein
VKVVSNASPLIILGRIDRLDLLPALFGAVHVASEVYEEVVLAGANRPAAAAIKAAMWIDVHPALSLAGLAAWRSHANLGSGELATIALAKAMPADWVVLDERAARQLATNHQLNVIGCVGILELAHRRKLVPDLRATYAQMLTKGVYIAPAILNLSLAACGLPAL